MTTSTGYRQWLWLGLLSLVSGCAAGAQYGDWQTRLRLDHPLVGKVWDARQRDWVSAGFLRNAASKAPVLLLGETHDHPDHHRIQAELLEAWLDAHDDAVVAFEQLDERQGHLLSHSLIETPEDVRRATHWDQSGWPSFDLYAPLFELALRPIAKPLAVHPSVDTLRQAVAAGLERADRELRLMPPPVADAMARLAQQIRDAHCGHAKEETVQRMVAAQRFKDAFMARVMYQSRKDHVALIAGSGHVRRDYGVPLYLQRQGEGRVLSVAFLPVGEQQRSVDDYPTTAYDLIVFTPPVRDTDPCEHFREQLERIKRESAKTRR